MLELNAIFERTLLVEMFNVPFTPAELDSCTFDTLVAHRGEFSAHG